MPDDSAPAFDRAAYNQHLAERNQRIVELRATGTSVTVLAERFGLERSSVKKYVLKHSSNGK